MTFLKTANLAFIIFTLILLNLFFYNSRKTTEIYTTETTLFKQDSVLSGKQLAQIYCKICHQFPEPQLLDKSTWANHVLPNMGMRMGIKIAGVDPFAGTPKEDLELVKSLGIYPDKPIITEEQWTKITDYYINEAPKKPIDQNITTKKITNLSLFQSRKVFINNKGFPRTSMLKFDKSKNLLYVGDASNLIYVLDDKMTVKKTWKMPSPAVDIDFPANSSPRILTIGKFNPSDQKLGSLLYNNTSLKNLPRPVSFTTADLNADSKEDVVICGFGHNTGKLFWYDNFNPEKEHVLKNMPGARKVEITDLNHDGKPDLVVLMAQAFEQVSVFYNLGNNMFEEKVVLKFPPVYGVSYLELVDFNKDGYQDILLTNGDNWDYSIIRKNYHGVRIYINDGHDNFENAFFYPLYGASKALARDFDNDGDLDIAASAFYNNQDKPEQSFIYLSNQGNMSFKAHSTPEAASGKWLTMDAADYDNDGDIDIFLGSYFHTFGEYFKHVSKGVSDFPQLLILTNNFEE
ncbi:FG-GAP repeat domain-containing protein [Hwangdonia lutea]|uniref:VCBS repeat-containing protein n=1 Tax=Hwangdonia lutea TaxID=3075823 RepID=A0AA97HQX3_9FLAO|nr:VCBS repeat-containing protein [Hwangdonia sp. SCSIO 19198]WOD44401.1 VCBS repeat-containing protein [Hwangdonia sp. SCSIO 19198]